MQGSSRFASIARRFRTVLAATEFALAAAAVLAVIVVLTVAIFRQAWAYAAVGAVLFVIPAVGFSWLLARRCAGDVGAEGGVRACVSSLLVAVGIVAWTLYEPTTGGPERNDAMPIFILTFPLAYFVCLGGLTLGIVYWRAYRQSPA